MPATQVTGAQVKDQTLTDNDVASGNKDGATGTPSMRTLGSGALQAAPGNHTHTLPADVVYNDQANTYSAGAQDMGAVTHKIPTAAGIALTTTEGFIGEDSTRHHLQKYDGVQQVGIDAVGWTTHALVLGSHSLVNISGNTITLPINGGAFFTFMHVTAHMKLQAFQYRNMDTSGLHTLEWRLYEDQQNNSGTLNEVPNANGTFSFTPTVASDQQSVPASAPIYLAPGIYLVVLRNTSASQTAGMGVGTGSAPYGNTCATKTLASALGATLDFLTSWVKGTGFAGFFLHGRVFGQTAIY